jgi:hypothetical protein
MHVLVHVAFSGNPLRHISAEAGDWSVALDGVNDAPTHTWLLLPIFCDSSDP